MFEIKPNLCLNNIYKKISEEDIIRHLFPNIKLKSFFSLRNETNKSESIKEYRGKLYIKDFGDAYQNKAETWYQYIARINNWNTKTTEGFLLALNWANKEFNLNLEEPNLSYLNNFNYKPDNSTNYTKSLLYDSKNKVIIEIKRRDWNKKDLDYWYQFGLTLEWLKGKNIAPISHLWLTNPNKDNIRKYIDISKKMSFVYPYYYEGDIFMYKIYSPLELNFKWLSNVNKNVIENWRFIVNRRKHLIIQSSLKDIGVMEYFRDNFNIFKDYDFIAPISEGIWFNNWNIIRKEYKKIIYYGNNDWNKITNSGLNYARKWTIEYNIPNIINPNFCCASDISDYRKFQGEQKTKELLIQLEEYCELL